MNNPSPSEWTAALARLHERLEQAEARHEVVMKSLKASLAALEARMPHALPPALPGKEVVPLPTQTGTVATSIPPEASILPGLQQAKREAAPPPMPGPPVPAVAGTGPALPPPLRKSGGSFELQLGVVWLVRIGVVLLLTGLVFAGNYAYKQWIHKLPPGAKLAGLYFCSLLLAGPGLWLSKKETYRRYGEVLIAAGLAFFYYCTYAAHQVERLRVIDSPVTGAVLLLGAAGLIGAVSWFRNSRATAVMGILLASYSTMVQPLDWLSAASNLMLAATGTALMLRPGWSGPGIASLAGTYAAFGGWQILGAAGEGHGDPKAALWFLPGTWAIFAIPGMFGRFRTSLGDQGRALFTGGNNAAFFATFSLIWLWQYGAVGFWQVPAVFGVVLLAMGAFGRKREDTAAASNVIQALASLSLALVLKFGGFQLGLALAGESLALAIAYHRFRKQAEFVFTILSGMGAAVMALALHIPEYEGDGVPLWSGALSAVLVALSAMILRYNVERSVDPAGSEVRIGAAVLAWSSMAILLFGFCARLPVEWKLPVVAGFSAAFAAVSLRLDKRRWMSELAAAAGVFGCVSFFLLELPTPFTGECLALAAGLVSCVLWHHAPGPRRSDVWLAADPATTPQPFAWLHAVLVPIVVTRLMAHGNPSVSSHIVLLAGAAIALVALARGLKADRLEFTAPFLNIGALLMVLAAIVGSNPDVSKTLSFTPAIAAVVILALVTVRRDDPLLPQVIITRATLFVAWAAALMWAVPRGFIDLMALSAAIPFAVAWKRRHHAPIDAWGWTILSLLVYLLVLADGSGSRFHGYLFEGVGLVAVLAYVAIWTPKLPASMQKGAEVFLPWLSCAMVTIWSTHICVDQFGWKSVAVLWTLLGFALVTFGLVFSRITSRKTGFILLGLALLKLFAADVWDFNTFTRVASFIALGLALVLLGLFYHRFAPALKRLMDDHDADGDGDGESAPVESPPAP